MSGRVSQLTAWMIAKAEQQELTLAQCKALTLQQVKNNLPAQHLERLTTTIFLKAKQQLINDKYQTLMDTLKNNTTVRQEILAVFPDAEFSVSLDKKKIIIDLESS